MILTISYFHENSINENEIIEFINKSMTTPVFVRLMNQNFKKAIKIERCNGETWFTWERERDRDHPHGKVKIFMSAHGTSFGTDEAGSTWWSPFGAAVWKLHHYKE